MRLACQAPETLGIRTALDGFHARIECGIFPPEIRDYGQDLSLPEPNANAAEVLTFRTKLNCWAKFVRWSCSVAFW